MAKKKKTSEEFKPGKRGEPDIPAISPWKVGQVANFRPKLYGYRIWQTGKIWDFAYDKEGRGVAFMTPCGVGWGKVTSSGSTWCIRVEHLHKKPIKTEDKRAKKQELYSTRNRKKRKKSR
jgi:hypothetical protein